MGRWSWSSRNTVEECEIIDMPWICRHGYLTGCKAGIIEWDSRYGGKNRVGIEVSVDWQNAWGSYMRLLYTFTHSQTKEQTDLDYKVPLVSTPCNFGGKRYWFICPLSVDGRSCCRRVSKLYLPPGSMYFGCRHCHNLTYQCQKERDKKVDALLKNPALMEMTGQMAKAGNIKAGFLLLKAHSKLEAKYKSRFLDKL